MTDIDRNKDFGVEKELKELLSDLQTPKMTPQESVFLTSKLNNRIELFHRKATGLYNFTIRYGTAIAAVLLLFVVSLISMPGIVSIDHGKQITENKTDTSMDEYADEMNLDENYFNAIIDSYVYDQGVYSGKQVIGEIDSEEFDYLVENIDLGGIL